MDAVAGERAQVVPELAGIGLVASWAAPEPISEAIEHAGEEPYAAEHTEQIAVVE